MDFPEAGEGYLKGAIADSTDAFTLLPGMRPATDVFVKADLCNAPNGVVTVQMETAFSNAQCFTSLDGVSFIANPCALSRSSAVGENNRSR